MSSAALLAWLSFQVRASVVLSGLGPSPVFCSLSRDAPFEKVCAYTHVCPWTCTRRSVLPRTQCICLCLCLPDLFVRLNKCAHGVRFVGPLSSLFTIAVVSPLYSTPLCFRCLVHLQFICRSVTVEGLEFDSEKSSPHTVMHTIQWSDTVLTTVS